MSSGARLPRQLQGPLSPGGMSAPCAVDLPLATHDRPTAASMHVWLQESRGCIQATYIIAGDQSWRLTQTSLAHRDAERARKKAGLASKGWLETGSAPPLIGQR